MNELYDQVRMLCTVKCLNVNIRFHGPIFGIRQGLDNGWSVLILLRSIWNLVSGLVEH